VSDEFDVVRRFRPDGIEPADPGDPAAYAKEKERLMSTIQGTVPAATLATPDLYPRLAYEDEYAAIEYLTRVFGFTEHREARMEHGEHCLAWLTIGSGTVMLGHTNLDVHRIASPRTAGLTTAIFHVYVHDIDAHHARAVAEGADVTMSLRDAFYGDRVYEATDLEGHRWHFGERFADIRARGGREPEPEDPPKG
jgi:uncharacterized glyoxalase superfamily protein PhnB